MGKLTVMQTSDPTHEDVACARPGARVRRAGLAPVQNFLFGHTPFSVVYDCR
ncbi:hypothetical protein GCM10010156_18430 [Planobispora rosea]|uniref:Uncharacterized protein n=1 Tax=Planobispora rosea TaxID=35762 RepID=A0A8J3S1H4_PLARO|nr:hypothetical protein GCM10010156_18430 [Planobispora rosea]GIH84057.1 hypothetical protein Pro02_24650 [Planobispora rosea]